MPRPHHQSAISANNRAFFDITLQFLCNSNRRIITKEFYFSVAAFWWNPVCAWVFVVKNIIKISEIIS